MTVKRTTSAAVAAGLVSVASLGIGATEAEARLGQYYGGVTSQGAPVVLELDRGSKAVKTAGLVVGADCGDGVNLTYFLRVRFRDRLPASVDPGKHVVTPRRVSRTGRFDAGGAARVDFGTATGVVQESVSGRLRRNGAASGTYHAILFMRDRGEGFICQTGTVRWRARSARGRVYAGSTAQQMPVVLELNARRDAVERMRFAWGAPCSPEGGFLTPDYLDDLSLTGGAFASVLQQPFDLGGGDKRTFDYDTEGSLAGAANASGRFSVKVAETDAAGAVTSTCETGGIRWTARSG